VALLSSALVASAGVERVMALAHFSAAWPEALAIGPALTVRGSVGDNLALHRAVDELAPGDIIVVAAGGPRGAGLCGDLLALAARRRGAAGIVVDGPVRDLVGIVQIGLPIFYRGTSPLGPRKDVPGELRVPIELDGVHIEPGDLVVADADGVVLVPARDAAEVRADAEALAAEEETLRARIEAGESTLDLLGLRPKLP
jgi:4-hydroxy-4-methyl-2-oxoglutarate aldolase